MTSERVTNGTVDPAHYGPIGDAARHIASYCDGPARVHVYTAAFDTLTEAHRLAHRGGEVVAWQVTFTSSSKREYGRTIVLTEPDPKDWDSVTPLYAAPPTDEVARLREEIAALRKRLAGSMPIAGGNPFTKPLSMEIRALGDTP